MINEILLWVFILAVLAFVVMWQFRPAPPPLQTNSITAKVHYVVDGDSLYLRGHKPQIRLWGVDASEKYESGYHAATDELKRLVTGHKLTCRIVDTDRYGRNVARCFLADGQEVNAAMIASGTAKEYKRFSKGFYSDGRRLQNTSPTQPNTGTGEAPEDRR